MVGCRLVVHVRNVRKLTPCNLHMRLVKRRACSDEHARGCIRFSN